MGARTPAGPLVGSPWPSLPRRRWPDLVEAASARIRWRSLEKRLAGGADPVGDPLLARRAIQLASRRLRTGTAASVESSIDTAHRPERRWLSSAVPVCRREVLIAEKERAAIARRLRDGAPIAPAGIARVRAMLGEGGSLLYVGGKPGALRAWARDVLEALDEGVLTRT